MITKHSRWGVLIILVLIITLFLTYLFFSNDFVFKTISINVLKSSISIQIPHKVKYEKISNNYNEQVVYEQNLDLIYKTINENIKYPKEAAEAKVSGYVIVKFNINEIGEIINISIIQSANEILETEVIRVIKLCPKLTPIQKDGNPYLIGYKIPVNFEFSPRILIEV